MLSACMDLASLIPAREPRDEASMDLAIFAGDHGTRKCARWFKTAKLEEKLFVRVLHLMQCR